MRSSGEYFEEAAFNTSSRHARRSSSISCARVRWPTDAFFFDAVSDDGHFHPIRGPTL